MRSSSIDSHRFPPMSNSSAACAVSAALLCSACSAAPSVAILGAYFPGWMLCALLGIGVTVLVRVVAGGVGLHRHGGPPLLYPLLALLCSAVIWILLFRGLP